MTRSSQTGTADGDLRITLAIAGDGPLPEPPIDQLGTLTTGPLGLLALLQTRLGIPSRDTPFTTRLIQYLACLDECDHPQAFYHRSYAADPFATARTLLQWRDQWYLAGWRGDCREDAPARLRDMASVERRARTAVEPGLGQQLQQLIALLRENPVALGPLTLRDPPQDFPHLWRSLIDTLDAAPVVEAAVTPSAPAGSDLRRLQDQLLSRSAQAVTLAQDGSLSVLWCDSARESSAATALLIQERLTDSPGKSLAVLAEQRGELLDEACESIGAPRLGYSALSSWRPVFQVLPLACELLWEPLDARALFQFLSHPVGPLPARQREALARVVAERPGIGSQAWEEALQACLVEEKDRDRQRERLDYWLNSERWEPAAGVPAQVLGERASRIGQWLAGIRETSEEPALRQLYDIAINQVQEFRKAIDRLREHGLDPLSRDNVLRLIEDVRGSGAPVTDRAAETAPGLPRALPTTRPGAFHKPADRVIWWDCQAGTAVRRWPWSQRERAALAAEGALLESEACQLERLGRAWLRPVLAAREECILVLHDDVDRQHPLWDQIQSLVPELVPRNLAAVEVMESLGLAREPLPTTPLPPLARWWQLPSETSLPARDSESYSSLDAFIYSPYQWLLRYPAKIRPGSLASVSDGALLKGNLAHHLLEQFFSEHPDIAAIGAAGLQDWIDTRAAPLLQQEGALLLEPGRQAEREQFVAAMAQALTALVGHLQAGGMTSVTMELEQTGRFAGGQLGGFIDLLATDSAGREVVVDIKWGGRNYRRESLRESSYLQLATYARLRLDSGAESWPHLSYFIVSDAHMLNLNHSLFPGAENIAPENGENTAQFWERFQHSWRWRKRQFDRGRVEVTVSGTEPTEDSLPGERGLPMPEHSDHFNDFAALTGWAAGE